MGVKKNELSDDTICVARYTLHVVYYLSWQTINRRYLHLIYLTSSKKLPGRHGRIPFDWLSSLLWSPWLLASISV